MVHDKSDYIISIQWRWPTGRAWRRYSTSRSFSVYTLQKRN